MRLEEFNQAGAAEVRDQLLACCDVPSWADAVLAGRPYTTTEDLVAQADRAAGALTDAEVEQALAAHPRIGERAEGASTEAAWSRGEQSGVTRDQATQRALLEGNRAYEERFGRVFLICATGLSAEQILADLHRRLGNDDAAERAEVATELRKIAALRTEKLVSA